MRSLMAIEDDFEISAAGDIVWTGAEDTYTVLEFHYFLRNSWSINADAVQLIYDNPIINCPKHGYSCVKQKCLRYGRKLNKVGLRRCPKRYGDF